MKRIYKYELGITDTQKVEVPYNSEVLCVKVQNNKPMLYAIVEPEQPSAFIYVHCRGTGHDFTGHEGHYFGTVQVKGYFGEELVFHFFGETSL